MPRTDDLVPTPEPDLEQETQETPPETPVEEQEPPEGAQEAPKSSELERIAREIGWTPKDQYRGPPENWRDPIEYIKEGASRHRLLADKLTQQEREYQSRFDRLEKTTQLAMEQQKRQLQERFEAQKAYHASQGDMENYNAARIAQERAEQDLDKRFQETIPSPQPGQLAPEAVDYITRNRDWYNRDPVMTGAAINVTGYYQQMHPNLPLNAIFSMVDDEMRRNFPQKFNGAQPAPQQQQQNRPPVTESGLRPIRGAIKKGWDALPAEAKQAGEGFIRDGLFGEDKKKARETYAEQYWDLG